MPAEHAAVLEDPLQGVAADLAVVALDLDVVQGERREDRDASLTRSFPEDRACCHLGAAAMSCHAATATLERRADMKIWVKDAY